MWGDGWNTVDFKPKKYKIMKNAEICEFPLYWEKQKKWEIEYNYENNRKKSSMDDGLHDNESIGIYDNREDSKENESLKSFFENSDKKEYDLTKFEEQILGEEENTLN